MTRNTIQDPAQPGLSHPQEVVGPREGNARVLVDQEDAEDALNKAVNSQLESKRAANVDNTACEIRKSNREQL